MEELIKTGSETFIMPNADYRSLIKLYYPGTVTDLVVVTLLRVNSTSTKESLARALFNLLARADLRQEMVELNVFEALIQLGNIEVTGFLNY